jgi:hypothetical protein
MRWRWQVCRALGAIALVDDALENALACATGDPPTTALLLGANEWNTRLSGVEAEENAPAGGVDVTQMSFAQRLKHAGGREFWKEDAARAREKIPARAPLVRVKDWEEVVRWVEENGPIRL